MTIRPLAAIGAAVVAATVGFVGAPAVAAPAPQPSVNLGCTIDPARGVTTAALTIRNVTRQVRWTAQYVHTNPDEPTSETTFVRGAIADTARTVLRFRFTEDDLLAIKVKQGKRELFSVRADTASGCGISQTSGRR